MVCSWVEYSWQAFHITHRPGFFWWRKRKILVQIFFNLTRKKGSSPWSAVECSVGKLYLATKYAVCNWYPPRLKQTKYNRCLPVQWLFQVNAFWEFSTSQVARLGLTKERRNWFALSKSLMYGNETLRSLFSQSLLRGFSSFGDGYKYISSTSSLESWGPWLSKHSKAISSDL